MQSLTLTFPYALPADGQQWFPENRHNIEVNFYRLKILQPNFLRDKTHWCYILGSSKLSESARTKFQCTFRAMTLPPMNSLVVLLGSQEANLHSDLSFFTTKAVSRFTIGKFQSDTWTRYQEQGQVEAKRGESWRGSNSLVSALASRRPPTSEGIVLNTHRTLQKLHLSICQPL